MAFFALFSQVFYSSYAFVGLGLGRALFYLFLVDHHNEGAFGVFVAKLTALVEEHGDLIDLHHHVREKELNTMHGLLDIKLHRLLATRHISSVARGRLIPHASLLQVYSLIAVVPPLLDHAQSLERAHEVGRGCIVNLLTCVVGKVVLEGYGETFLG